MPDTTLTAEFYTVREAAAIYGCARATLQQRIGRGEVTVVRSPLRDDHGNEYGYIWLISADELRRIMGRRDERAAARG